MLALLCFHYFLIKSHFFSCYLFAALLLRLKSQLRRKNHEKQAKQLIVQDAHHDALDLEGFEELIVDWSTKF